MTSHVITSAGVEVGSPAEGIDHSILYDKTRRMLLCCKSHTIIALTNELREEKK